jgi:hypothetical protein
MMWQLFHKRFSMSGDDPTEDLSLVAKTFEETVKTENI